MRAEQRTSGSTGGIALHYDSPMRISNVITLSLLLAPLLACGEDAPTRPENGTVTAWQACRWDGQILPELCAEDLVCTYHGICAPICETAEDCPMFDGFEIECSSMDADQICKPLCNESKDCSQTDEAALECLNRYCIGSS